MTNNQYTKTAIVLHWLIGLGILAMLGLGWYMADLPKDAPKAMSFDLFDLGIVASYNDGTYVHTGIARNHTNDIWTFFDGVVAEPTVLRFMAGAPLGATGIVVALLAVLEL